MYGTDYGAFSGDVEFAKTKLTDFLVSKSLQVVDCDLGMQNYLILCNQILIYLHILIIIITGVWILR